MIWPTVDLLVGLWSIACPPTLPREVVRFDHEALRDGLRRGRRVTHRGSVALVDEGGPFVVVVVGGVQCRFPRYARSRRRITGLCASILRNPASGCGATMRKR